MATERKDLENDNGTINPEVMPPETHLVRSPAVPTTVDELAASEEGQAIIEARVQILETLRKASIRATSPQDWLLFKAIDLGGNDPDRITGFLQDQGCQRVRPLWGIDITPTSDFEKTTDTETGDFAYKIKGDGFCALTKSVIKDITGLRYSTDHFLKDTTGIVKEMRVQQAARANLDGNITRKLTGLGGVAIEEIQEVWKGTWKTLDLCPKGKGYGSGKDRAGASANGAPTGKAPLCEMCGKPMKFWAAKGDMVAAYRCSEFKWDSATRTGNGHSRISASEYEKRQAAAAKSKADQSGQEG